MPYVYNYMLLRITPVIDFWKNGSALIFGKLHSSQNPAYSLPVDLQAHITTPTNAADCPGDSGTKQLPKRSSETPTAEEGKGAVIGNPGDLVPIICQSITIGAAVLAPDQLHASKLQTAAEANYPKTSCALQVEQEESVDDTLAASTTASSLSIANKFDFSSSSSSIETTASSSSSDSLSSSSPITRKDTASPALPVSESTKLSTTALSAHGFTQPPANLVYRTQPSSAKPTSDLAGITQSTSSGGGYYSTISNTASGADRGDHSFAFSELEEQLQYSSEYLVKSSEREEEQEGQDKGAFYTINTQDAPLGESTKQQHGSRLPTSVIGGTSGFFRRTIGQQQASYPVTPLEPNQSNLAGSGPGSASGTPVSLGSLTTSTSLGDSTSSSPSLSYSMGDISLMSHQPASSFRQQGLGGAGHYQPASLSPPPTLGQFNGNGISSNRKTSSSIFDAFSPLGPAPQHDSPASHTPNPPVHSAAATKQAMRANHPNAPFERAGVDALTQQLAGTSISTPSNMYSRRSGVVKFFNSTKGFGFIWDNASHEIGDVDIFVHWTTVQGDASFKSLAEGEMVEYELGRGPKGLQAINVTGPNGGNVQGDPLARMPLSIGGRAQLMPLSRFNPMSIPIPVHPLMISGYPGPQHAHLETPYYVLSNGRFVQQQPVAFLPQVIGQQGGLPSSNGYGNAVRDSANMGAGSPAYMFANQAPGPARNTAPGAPVYAGSPFDQTFSSPSRGMNGYQATQTGRQSSGLPRFNPSPSNISSTSIHHLNETSNPAGPIGSREKIPVDSDKLAFFGSAAWRKD